MKTLSLKITYPAFIISLALILSSSPEVYCAPSTIVLIYGFEYDTLAKFYSTYFSQRFGQGSVQTRYLNASNWRGEFLNVTKVVTAMGIQTYIQNSSTCVPCQQQGGQPNLTMDDILLYYASPMVLVFYEGRLAMVLFDGVDPEALVRSLDNPDVETLVILTPNGNYYRNDAEFRKGLEDLVLMDIDLRVRLTDVLLPVISLAIVDSINPCTFLLFTGLLLMVHMTSGRKERTLKTGLLFSLAVFTGYYLLGMGLTSLLRYAIFMKLIIIALGLMMSVSSIVIALMGVDRCPMPGPIKKLLAGQLFVRSYYSLGAVFALGLLTSFTLLPCSSGPYIVSLTFLQALGDIDRYLLLAFYNLIFVAPLIAISFLVFLSENAFDRINKFKRTRLNLVELIGGITLGIICVYLLWELLIDIGI